MARPSFAQLVGTVLTNQGYQAHSGEGQENKAGYLQPELVYDASQMAEGSAYAVPDRTIGPRLADLAAGNARHNAQFPGT